MTYDVRLYARNEALRIFLQTLSYHTVGAAFLAQHLKDSEISRISTLIDVGAGDGTFTRELLVALDEMDIMRPDAIIAIDPDQANLTSYQRKVGGLAGSIQCIESTLEDYEPNCNGDLVVCSHALYGTLENPALNDDEKCENIRKLFRILEPTGQLFISMASRSSPAYAVKREIEQKLGRPDASAFGEHVQTHLYKTRVEYAASVRSSYMDVSEIVENKEALLKWCSYFCRVEEPELALLGADVLVSIIVKHAKRFSEQSKDLQRYMHKFPAEMGDPSPDTLFLPHAEIFITV